jgi:hypothetical protein
MLLQIHLNPTFTGVPAWGYVNNFTNVRVATATIVTSSLGTPKAIGYTYSASNGGYVVDAPIDIKPTDVILITVGTTATTDLSIVTWFE